MSDSVVDFSDHENNDPSRSDRGKNASMRPRRRESRSRSSNSVTVPSMDSRNPAADAVSAVRGGQRAPVLADITKSAVNTKTRQSSTLSDADSSPPESRQMPAEKPMDIAIRAKAKPALAHTEDAEPKPRMVIKGLVLTNFKSYAGRQEVGPFHASFSSVVGPNGSGKSNVIDSLLFVFGFRASKMRQGKISSLIHNSAAFPDLDHCEVEVHFEKIIDRPSGHKEYVQGSATVVSRKAFKNNSSKYYIDRHESNFTTVTSMLRDEGIDLDHKRFLILQGEVESIAQMKPKAATEHDDGLLEYLEDIIGTSKYKSPIEQCATEVDTLNEVCREKHSRFDHVDREKTGLESKKAAALGHISAENELAQKQSALWQIFSHECSDNIEITNEAVSQIQEQLTAETESHRVRKAGLAALNETFSAESAGLDKLRQRSQKAQLEVTKAEKEKVKSDEKKKHLHTKLKKLEKSMGSSESALSESSAQLERLRADVERGLSATSRIESELHREESTLAAIRDGLKGKTEGLSDHISQKQKALAPWYTQISDKKSAIAVAESELSILRDRESSNSRALQEAEEKLEHLQQTKRQKQEDLRSLQQQIQQEHLQTQEVQDLLKKSTAEEPQARARLTASRQRVTEARASLVSAQSQGQVLKSLMRLSDTGRIKGFHGRLGNLGAIDGQYDIAISTACPSLNNLVVDTVEVGQQCIDHLRKGNLGRANFILLDRLGQRSLAPIETPENVPRLFDLVKVKDERFLPAFYSVLQDTLVAKDLSQAQRVAYGSKRWRVVTLDGKVIDKSGTMSGGGAKPARGAMSSQVVALASEEQVSKLEHDHAHEESRWNEFQQDRLSITASLKAASEKLPILETKLEKSTLDVNSIAGNVVDIEKRLKELRSFKAPHEADQSRTEALQLLIRQRNEEISEISESTAGLEAEIKSLQEKILDIGGVKLRSQKAKVDGLKGELTTLGEEVANAQVETTKAQKAIVKHSSARDAASTDIDQARLDMDQLEQSTSLQDADTAELKNQADEAQKALDLKDDEVAELKKQVDAQSIELNDFRGKEIELRNQLEENQKVLQENGKRLKYWQEKLAKLVLQNVSDIDASIEEQTLAEFSRDELADLDKSQLKGEIAALEERTQNSNIDLGVLSEYRRRAEELALRSADLRDAIDQRDAAKRRCEELRRIRLEGFMEGFSTISLRLKEMYQMITMGGNAELELVDSLDPFSEGILFSVMPPKKSWKNISNLSGGEKTLSSLALVFALHHYKPTPLYVMDEIDAALDFRNVSIVASYIKERTKNAQFIVISLRNNMFELASRLVGVYKVNHMTKSVTVENRDYMRQ